MSEAGLENPTTHLGVGVTFFLSREKSLEEFPGGSNGLRIQHRHRCGSSIPGPGTSPCHACGEKKKKKKKSKTEYEEERWCF